MPDNEKNILDSFLDLVEGGVEAFETLPDKDKTPLQRPSVIDVKPEPVKCNLCDGERYMQEDDGSYQPCPLCNNKFGKAKQLPEGTP